MLPPKVRDDIFDRKGKDIYPKMESARKMEGYANNRSAAPWPVCIWYEQTVSEDLYPICFWLERGKIGCKVPR